MSADKNRKKYTEKLISVLRATLLCCSGISALAMNAVNQASDQDNTGSAVDSTTNETSDKAEAGKNETVYVLAKADGSVEKIIVSDWIKNSMDAASLKDRSDLKNIKNVKGEETYTLDTDGMQVWDAQGKDIYYQGTIDKSLPVDLSLKYTLDGQPISPEELAGKSGKVTLRFDYTNNQYEYVEIDGEKTKINVPFIMLTGMILDNDHFRNIEVTNGKIINDGDRTAVIGFALPGIQDNLGIDKEKMEIPSYVEISAKATDFELSATMTLATNSVFNGVDLSKADSLHSLKDKMSTLTDSMAQLIDGSSQLYSGLSTLLNKSEKLIQGIHTLAGYSGQISDGAVSMNRYLKEAVSNNADLNNGAETVFNTLLATVSSEITSNGIQIDALTISNYKNVINGLLESPSAVQKSQLIAIADKTLNTKLAENGIPEQYYNAVKWMLYEQMSTGKTQDEAMQNISSVLTDAVFASGVNAAQPDSAVQAAVLNETGDITTAVTVAKICTYLASVKGGNATDYVSAAQAMVPSLQEKTENAKKLQTAVQTAETAQGKAAVSGLCLTLAQETLKPSLESAVKQLDSYHDFYQGLKSYTSAIQQICDGSGELAQKTEEFAKGMEQLKSQSAALPEGVKELKDGSLRISDGLKQLNEQGVQKLADVMNGDIGSMIARLRATVDVSKHYQSFSGIAEGESGDVKFIYKTASIEK